MGRVQTLEVINPVRSVMQDAENDDVLVSECIENVMTFVAV